MVVRARALGDPKFLSELSISSSANTVLGEDKAVYRRRKERICLRWSFKALETMTLAFCTRDSSSALEGTNTNAASFFDFHSPL
jgi:hypothetical protein